MKPLLLGGSLLANAVLALALVIWPTLAPPGLRDLFVAHSVAASSAASATTASRPGTPAPKLWPQLETEDLKQLVQRLRGAGFPPEVIRRVIQSLVDARFSARIRALADPDPTVPYWKQRPYFGFGEKRFWELQQIQQERSRTIRDLLGDPALADAEITAADRRRYGNLSPAKIAMLQRIEEDYTEMQMAARAGMQGIELPEDRAKFELLANEKRKDLLTVLTPDEMADYEMRTSSLTNALRTRFGNFEPTETEYRAIYQTYAALGQKLGATDLLMRMDNFDRGAAETTLTSQLQSALGTERYNEMTRAMDGDYHQFQQLAEKQNLPASAADEAYALRNSVAQQSVSIVNDPSLSAGDKRAQLKLLADNTRLQFANIMPGDAGQTYLQHANWLQFLDHGMGVTISSAPPLIMTSGTGAVSSFISNNQVRPVPIKRGRP